MIPDFVAFNLVGLYTTARSASSGYAMQLTEIIRELP